MLTMQRNYKTKNLKNCKTPRLIHTYRKINKGTRNNICNHLPLKWLVERK